MNVQVTLPGTVTINEDGSPWPIELDFVHRDRDIREVLASAVRTDLDSPTNPGDLLNTRIQIGSAGEHVEIDPEAVRRIATDYAIYVRLARNALLVHRSGFDDSVAMLRAQGRTRRGLSDDFYRRITAEFIARTEAGGDAVREIARSHHAGVSTVYRWIKEARSKGFLDDRGEPE